MIYLLVVTLLTNDKPLVTPEPFKSKELCEYARDSVDYNLSKSMLNKGPYKVSCIKHRGVL